MNLPIAEFDNEPRVVDLALAESLGFTRPRAIRQIIERNTLELQAYGPLATRCGKSRGQQFTEYWLNEPQALLICMFSHTPNAARVRKLVIDVFTAWRQGKTVHVREHMRRPATRPARALPPAEYTFELNQASAGADFTVQAFVPATLALRFAELFVAEMGDNLTA